MTIHQSDHFDIAHTSLSCTAAPIYDSSGSMMGVLDVSLLMSPSEKYSQALTLEVVKSCVRRIELANLMSTRKSDWLLRLNSSSEFLNVDPSCAISVGNNGEISGLTHGAHKMIAEKMGKDTELPDGFIGKPFEDVFNIFDI